MELDFIILAKKNKKPKKERKTKHYNLMVKENYDSKKMYSTKATKLHLLNLKATRTEN